MSKVKSPDPSDATVTSPTAGTPSDRGGEETEEGKDADTDIKDEIGSGASSPQPGMNGFMAFVCGDSLNICDTVQCETFVVKMLRHVVFFILF